MSDTQEQFIISIMSRDRVGIVHEISNAVSQLNGNLADVRQTLMCGYFTMILLASFPPEVTQRTIERKLAEVDARSETPIVAAVKKLDATDLRPSADFPENSYVLTARGPDRIGFVATVSNFCKEHNINILDLSTTASDQEYLMILIIDLSQAASITQVRQDLKQFTQETGLQMVLQHRDIFRAVNEINLPARAGGNISLIQFDSHIGG